MASIPAVPTLQGRADVSRQESTPGEHVLVVRRIAFESVSALVVVAAGADLTADVDLRPSAPAQLGEVRVVADSQRLGKLAGMEHRRSIQAGGSFMFWTK